MCRFEIKLAITVLVSVALRQEIISLLSEFPRGIDVRDYELVCMLASETRELKIKVLKEIIGHLL